MSLDQAAAPSNTTEGWKPDPLNPEKQRWWDGTEWTERIGTPTKVAAFPGTNTQDLAVKTPEERRAALAQRLQYIVNVDHARIESQTDYQAVVVTGKPTNHILHLLLSIFTLGLWIPVWIILAIVGGEKRRIIAVDDFGQVLG